VGKTQEEDENETEEEQCRKGRGAIEKETQQTGNW